MFLRLRVRYHRIQNHMHHPLFELVTIHMPPAACASYPSNGQTRRQENAFLKNLDKPWLHESPPMADIEIMFLEELVETGTGEAGDGTGLGDVAGRNPGKGTQIGNFKC